MTEPVSPSIVRVPLRTVAFVYLRLGTTGFGGPAAHIALMEDECVLRRGWLTRTEFLDLVGATNLIPGPNSTELAIHIGYRVAGWPGLALAGVCFISPAALIATALAWGYVTYGHLPAIAGGLAGVKAVVVAVVVQALWRLGRSCLRSALSVAVAVAAVGLTVLGVHELLVLFGAGAGVMMVRGRKPGVTCHASVALLAVPMFPTAVATPLGSWPLFLAFLKVGSVLFGSGYVLLAFLRADLVERHGWLSEQQLLDAVAVGQMVPGPVFTTATFIGYVLGGPVGAAVATTGIFLPAFAFVALSLPILPRLRRSAVAGAFLDGVNAAYLALMAVVAMQLGRAAVVDGVSAGLAVVAGGLLLRYRVNLLWLVLGGAAVGVARFG